MGLWLRAAVTDANGEAKVTITVSMQPGDNYRAAASVIPEAVQSQIDQTDADALSALQITTVGGTRYWVSNGDFAWYQVPVGWVARLVARWGTR